MSPSYQKSEGAVSEDAARNQDVKSFLSLLYRKGASLSLVKGKLHCRAPRGMLTPEDISALRKFESAIRAVLATSEPYVLTAPPILEPRSPSEPRPLSFQQEDYFEASLRLFETPEYVRGDDNLLIHSAVEIVGPLDRELLRKSVEGVVRRHEALRSRLSKLNNIPTQKIEDLTTWKIDLRDLSNVPNAETKEKEAQRLVCEFVSQWVVVERDPLFQTLLIKLAENDHLLVIVIHHAIGDAASVALIFRELWTLYSDFDRGKPSSLAPVRLQYSDYAVWQRASYKYFREKHSNYWSSRLSGAQPMRWPSSCGLECTASNTTGPVKFSFDERVTSALYNIARSERVLLSMAVLVGFVVVASRWCNQTDFVIPFPISGRTLADHSDIVGCLYQLLFLRVQLNGDETFRDLLRSVSKEFVTASEHAHGRAAIPQMEEFLCGGMFQWQSWNSVEFDEHDAPQEWRNSNPFLKFKSFPFKPHMWMHNRSSCKIVLQLFNSSKGIDARGFYRADTFTPKTIGLLSEDVQSASKQLASAPWSSIRAFRTSQG